MQSFKQRLKHFHILLYVYNQYVQAAINIYNKLKFKLSIID